MSRRNQHNKVDTFPFLAVLLCAMGSLILVLLVMDRRSKLAAQARGLAELTRRADDHSAQRAQRQREHDEKKRSLRDLWTRKRDALQAKVGADEQALDAELRQVQANLADAARKLRQEEDSVKALREQLQTEQGRVVSQEKALDGARDEARVLTGKLTVAERARAKMAEDLAELEKLLRAAKETRQRDSETYSVIPYQGKRGDSRRPLYVECNESGVLFHPDKLKLDSPSLEALRAEIDRRVARQKSELATEGVSDAKAYLMLLVRPSGVRRYYELQAVARELNIDFGYEFVDADWSFAFPAKTSPAEPVLASRADTTTPPRPKPSGGDGSVGFRLMPSNLVSRQGGSPGAASSGSVSPGNGLSAIPSPGGGSGSPSPGSVGGAPSSGSVAGAPSGGTTPGVQISRPQLHVGAGIAPGGPGLGRPGAGEPSGSGDGPALPGGTPAVSMHRPVARPVEGGSSGIEPPPLLPSTGGTGGGKSAASSGGSAGGTNPPTSAGDAGPRTSGSGLGTVEPGQKPVALRPARIHGEDETVIYVECRADLVIVYPARKQIGVDSLNHTAPYNPLTQTVLQLMRRQQGLARQGGTPPRFHVRFLVHPEGERTYHRAYPPLETVPAPKTRYNLMPDDSVARIVAGH